MLGSKLGADCSLLASPENTKLTCCPLVLPRLELELELELELLLEEDGRRSIQGTATCLPAVEDKLLPDELLPGVVLPPELELLGEELLLEPPNELLEEAPEELLPGLELEPELLPLEFRERTAKSMRPEAGLMISSLIVPTVSPEEPVTLAPINWLARSSWWPMRPIAPQCRPDWLP